MASYMRYKVVSVDIDGSQDKTSHENYQAKRQAAEAVEGRLLRPQRQDQLIFILRTHIHTSLYCQRKAFPGHFNQAYSSSP